MTAAVAATVADLTRGLPAERLRNRAALTPPIEVEAQLVIAKIYRRRKRHMAAQRAARQVSKRRLEGLRTTAANKKDPEAAAKAKATLDAYEAKAAKKSASASSASEDSGVLSLQKLPRGKKRIVLHRKEYHALLHQLDKAERRKAKVDERIKKAVHKEREHRKEAVKNVREKLKSKKSKNAGSAKKSKEATTAAADADDATDKDKDDDADADENNSIASVDLNGANDDEELDLDDAKDDEPAAAGAAASSPAPMSTTVVTLKKPPSPAATAASAASKPSKPSKPSKKPASVVAAGSLGAKQRAEKATATRRAKKAATAAPAKQAASKAPVSLAAGKKRKAVHIGSA